MSAFLYRIECLTNLHAGSGDANYSVVDNEVEKDTVLGCPIIHASGVKGALRDFAKEKKLSGDDVDKLFGKPASKDESFSNSGTVKFMDACLLSRPLRVKNCQDSSFIQTTTADILNHFIRQATAFGCLPAGLKGLKEIAVPDFGENEFLVTGGDTIRVEDEKTGSLDDSFAAPLKKLLGDRFAVAKSLEDYPLPVIARNKLENKISKTLWYEEYVPHDSVFFLIVLAPDEKALDWLPDDSLAQFGGNASVGCGYTRLTRWGGFNK